MFFIVEANKRNKVHFWLQFSFKLCYYKMNVIKWELNFGSCNFGLKSYL